MLDRELSSCLSMRMELQKKWWMYFLSLWLGVFSFFVPIASSANSEICSPPFRVGLLDLKWSPLLLLPPFLLLLPSLQKQQIYPTAEAPVRIDDPSLNMSFKHIFQVKVKQHFLHEKGRDQTLRRETWSTLLQITLRVFFMSKKHGNHKNKH